MDASVSRESCNVVNLHVANKQASELILMGKGMVADGYYVVQPYLKTLASYFCTFGNHKETVLAPCTRVTKERVLLK